MPNPDEAGETFFGYEPEEAVALFGGQIDWIECLCHLGQIWAIQMKHHPQTVPIEREIHGS